MDNTFEIKFLETQLDLARVMAKQAKTGREKKFAKREMARLEKTLEQVKKPVKEGAAA